jgi:hypothetical protein
MSALVKLKKRKQKQLQEKFDNYSPDEAASDLEAIRKLQTLRKSQEILLIENPPLETRKKFDESILDPWSKILCEIDQQLKTNIRSNLCGSSYFEELANDNISVKFLKGVVNEWKDQLFSLKDEDLLMNRNEVQNFWQSFFVLQPLFEGLNQKNVSR